MKKLLCMLLAVVMTVTLLTGCGAEASGDMFSVSQNVVQRILLGGLNTPKEAFDAFKDLLTKREPADGVAAHIDTAYSNQFTAEHGNLAASAIYNTVRAEAGYSYCENRLVRSKDPDG